MMPTIEQSNGSPSAGRGDRRVRLCLYAAASGAMLLAGAMMWTRSLTEWDSWEYAYLAVGRQPSDLCLRRWWFVWLMRMAWEAGSLLGVGEALTAYQPMKMAVLLSSAGSVAAVTAWTYRLTRRVGAAAVAAVMGLASPALLLYATTVMTEGPTLLCLALAMIGWESAISSRRRDRSYGWAAIAGLLFGVAVNMREPAMFLAGWPVVSCFIDRPRRRWGLLATAMVGAGASLGFGVWMAWQWSGDDPLSIMRAYSQYMRTERATYGFHGLANAGYLMIHLLLSSPVAALALLGAGVASVVKRMRRRRRPTDHRGFDEMPGRADARAIRRRLTWLGLSTLPYAVMTWYNPNLVFNYRLLLPLAWMLIPIAASLLEGALREMAEPMPLLRRRAGGPIPSAAPAATLLVGASILMVIAWNTMMVHALDYQRLQDRIYRRLSDLPDGAVIIPGAGSTAAEYLRRVGGRGDWRVITTDINDFDWSAEGLGRQIAEGMAAGKRAFANLNPAGWTRRGSDPWEFRNLYEAVSRFDQRPFDDHFVELLPRPD